MGGGGGENLPTQVPEAPAILATFYRSQMRLSKVPCVRAVPFTRPYPLPICEGREQRRPCVCAAIKPVFSGRGVERECSTVRAISGLTSVSGLWHRHVLRLPVPTSPIPPLSLIPPPPLSSCHCFLLCFHFLSLVSSLTL